MLQPLGATALRLIEPPGSKWINPNAPTIALHFSVGRFLFWDMFSPTEWITTKEAAGLTEYHVLCMEWRWSGTPVDYWEDRSIRQKGSLCSIKLRPREQPLLV